MLLGLSLEAMRMSPRKHRSEANNVGRWLLLQVRAVAVAALPPLERQVPLVEVPAEDAPSLRCRHPPRVSTVADTDHDSAAQVCQSCFSLLSKLEPFECIACP